MLIFTSNYRLDILLPDVVHRGTNGARAEDVEVHRVLGAARRAARVQDVVGATVDDGVSAGRAVIDVAAEAVARTAEEDAVQAGIAEEEEQLEAVVIG